MDKRGGIGSIMISAVATVIIIIILFVFAILGGIMSSFESSAADILLLKETDIGIGAVLNYEGFSKVLETKEEIKNTHSSRGGNDET